MRFLQRGKVPVYRSVQKLEIQRDKVTNSFDVAYHRHRPFLRKYQGWMETAGAFMGDIFSVLRNLHGDYCSKGFCPDVP